MVPSVQRAVDRLFSNVRTFGVRACLHDTFIRGANRAAYLRILKCVVVTTVRDVGECTYEHGFVDRARLRRWMQQPEYELDPAFVEEALAKGDRCYAIWDQETLASYGWYAYQPTAVNDDLTLSFDPAYVYMYKGFTHPRYRGQRLHAIGMSLALASSLQQGFRGLLSYVESNNFASLKSCYRMGYRDAGWIGFAKVFGTYFIHASAGCRDYGLRLDPRPAALAAAMA